MHRTKPSRARLLVPSALAVAILTGAAAPASALDDGSRAAPAKAAAAAGPVDDLIKSILDQIKALLPPGISLPPINIPEIKLPEIKLPEIPGVDLPEIPGVEIPKLPPLVPPTLPDPAAPVELVPEIPEIPDFEIPDFEIPGLPEAKSGSS
ncbi:hypothetical protein [Streptomyces sp. ISL-94]|uniref:hypothetical protein n=1 Tax=Streptomyces sp. ISL-94 TaxID=2819190 RepID=UPI001BE85A2D|nr:hypothetical protein [Streptomyces sp. ISL-94]MBT2479499.1 hypothetical protein [Streptomyces sp. ISL-94]